MRWLKSLVIVLAVLIAVAIGLLGYGFFKRTQDPDWRLFSVTKTETEAPVSDPPAPTQAPASVPAPAAAAPAVAPWGDINLALGPNCRITNVTPDGDRLYLSIGPDGPCHRVVVVDTAAGRVLGTVRTGP